MVIVAVRPLVNSAAMFMLRAHGHNIVLKQEAFWLLAVAGIAAAGVDIFALLAYESSHGSLHRLSWVERSMCLVLLVGFFWRYRNL